MTRILLFGCNGQVGWELQRSLAPVGNLISLDRNSTGGDLSNLDEIFANILDLRPDVIVNAAAYTAVDKAESEQDLAFAINDRAPDAIARAASAVGALLVHFSTDYVFDGRGTAPWVETAETSPLSVYGLSKLAGETAIREHCGRHLIFRTSWVYAARGTNFAKTMLRLAKERDSLNVINDQIGAPTSAELLSDVAAHAIRMVLAQPEREAHLLGTFNVAASGATSWYEYAQTVLQYAELAGVQLKVHHTDIKAIPTADYPTPAKRPLNSRLDITKLQRTFGLHMPPWQDGVQRMLQEILAE